MEGLARARRDLEEGRPRLARERLKGVLSSTPQSRDARQLLAEAYRQDHQWPEAGRWGYLVATDATSRERRAFETHATVGLARGLTRRRLRHLLRVDDLHVIADDYGDEVVAHLPIHPFTVRGWLPDRPPPRERGPLSGFLAKLEAVIVEPRVRWELRKTRRRRRTSKTLVRTSRRPGGM